MKRTVKCRPESSALRSTRLNWRSTRTPSPAVPRLAKVDGTGRLPIIRANAVASPFRGRSSEQVRRTTQQEARLPCEPRFFGDPMALNLRRLTRPPNLAASLMTQSLYVETRIVGFTLYSLGEFRYMRNIEDFSAVVQRQISGRESSRESHLVHTQARTRRAGGTKWRNSMRSSEVAW